MKGTSFVALYRGSTIASARLVAVSADPALAAEVSERLLRESPPSAQDQVLSTLEQGRRAALRLIRKEADDASDD